MSVKNVFKVFAVIFSLLPCLAGADITIVASNSNTTGGNPDISMSKPTGTADGDVLFACYGNTSSDTTSITLSGWTPIDLNTAGGGSANTFAAWYKVASSEPGTYTFDNTGSSANNTSASIITLRGVDTSNPLDVAYVEGSHFIRVQNDATPNVPDITTVTNGALVVYCAHTTGGTTTTAITPATNYDEQTEVIQNNRYQETATRIIATAGAQTIGDITLVTGGGGEDTSIITVAFRPAAISADPDFDSGPTLDDCDDTSCTFDYDANADADHIWGMCLSTAESTPSAAAIKAGTGSNGDANEASTGSADTLAITFTDSPVFPIYNCHFVAEEGTGNFSSVVSVLSVMPDAPTGKAFWPILSIGTDSPCERFNTATAPDIAANDWLLSDDATDPGAYALTVLNTCQFSYTGDSSRQSVLDIGVYDASAGGWHADDIDFWANNIVPVCDPEEDPLVILLYKDEEMASTDLESLGGCFDEDSDTLSYAVDSGSLPTGTSLSGTGNKDWGGTPTVEDESGEDITIGITDVPGDTTSYNLKVYVTDDVIVAPDCVTGGVDVSECLVFLNALRPWLDESDAIVATFSYSDTVAENDIVSQDPVASATMTATSALSVVVSLGAAPVFDSTTSTQHLRFRKTPEGLRTH